MGRLFLSGQTTCALLLGAGLLLRAQAALTRDPESVAAQQTAALESPGTRKSQMFEDRAARAARAPRPVAVPRAAHVAKTTIRADQAGETVAHSRKGFAHRAGRAQGKRCGARLARGSRSFKCG